MPPKPKANQNHPKINLPRPGQEQLEKAKLAKEKSALRRSFLMGVGSTIALGFVAYGAFNSFMPKKNEVAGTWRLTDGSFGGFALPISAVVTSDSKLFIQNPENPQDYLDLGRLNRISEASAIPKSAQVSNLSTRNRHRGAQQDAKNNINILTIAQMAYITEKDTWGNWSDLAVKVEAETEYYTYTTTIEPTIKTITAADLEKSGKTNLGIALQQAVPKQPKLRSYLGIAYLAFDPKLNQLQPFKLICESTDTLKAALPSPEFDAKKNKMTCPRGFIPVETN